MTDQDPVAEFMAALPAELRRLWRPNLLEVRYLVQEEGLANGWTPARLAEECSTGLHGVIKPAAVLMSRLRRLARDAAPRPQRGGKFTQPLPWCGADLCDPAGRFQLDPDTLTPVGRCPTCYTAPS